MTEFNIHSWKQETQPCLWWFISVTNWRDQKSRGMPLVGLMRQFQEIWLSRKEDPSPGLGSSFGWVVPQEEVLYRWVLLVCLMTFVSCWWIHLSQYCAVILQKHQYLLLCPSDMNWRLLNSSPLLKHPALWMEQLLGSAHLQHAVSHCGIPRTSCHELFQ